jgi:predicted 3-demethylubiquinone-9 3-methyltransferase (glyoxalase superfamily)
MGKIGIHLWLDREARAAAELYVSLMAESRIQSVTTLRNTPSGDTELVAFEVGGQPFMAISAGPLFQPNPAISFHLRYATAGEVDEAWAKLAPGGKTLMPLDRYPFSARYGWIEDRYGFSWQLVQMPDVEQRVMPALMFVGPVCGRAEEAMTFYSGVFESPAPQIRMRYGVNDAPDKAGTVRFGTFTLRGQVFGAMDSARAHRFGFNEAISLMVACETQAEIDYYWEALAADPNAGQCGWLKDKFGVSWQVTPAGLAEMMRGDAARAGRVTQAFLKMKKFDVAALRRAYEEE